MYLEKTDKRKEIDFFLEKIFIVNHTDIVLENETFETKMQTP